MAIEHPHWLLYTPRPRLPADGSPYPKRWWALPAVALCVFTIAIDISIVGIAGPSITTDLGATSAELQWVFDAFTIFLAGFVLVGGGLAERYGRKGVLQIGLTIFAIGSLIAAFSTEPAVLIAGRAVTGFGAALVFPPALSVLSALFPEDERPRAIGIWAAVAACGLALGPVVGGLLLSEFWVGSVFIVNVPVCAVTLVLLGILLPKNRGSDEGSLDTLGAALSFLGLGGIIYAVIEGPAQGWTDPNVLLAAVVGIVATIAFVFRELRLEYPLFDIRVLTIRRVVAGALAMSMVYFTMNSVQFLIPQYLEYVEGLSTVEAGLVMLPLGVGMVFLSPQSSKLVGRFGQRTMLTFTLSCMAAGMGILGLVSLWGGVPNVVLGLIVFVVGFGLVVAPATSAIMVALPVTKAGDGASVNLVSRQVGGAFGIAIIGTVATLVYRNDLSGQDLDLSESQTAELDDSLAGVESLSSELSGATAQQVDAAADAALSLGVQWGMLVGAAFAAGSAILAHRFEVDSTSDEEREAEVADDGSAR